MAELFHLPFPVAFNANGIAEPGAKLFFYVTGTTAPAPIYTASTMDVEHENPVEANGAGRFPNIYLDEAVTYRLVITDRNGSPLGVDVDPYTPGSIVGSAKGDKGDPGINGGVGSSAGFAALFGAAGGMTIGTDITRIRMAGYSTAGVGAADYVYDATVNALTVASNPRTQFLAAGGRGFRLALDQEITPYMFGATSPVAPINAGASFASVPDATTALQAFLDFCAANPVQSVNWGGTFGVTAGLTLGSTTTSGGQIVYSGANVYSGELILAVTANIAGAVLTCHSRRLCTYGPLHILGPDTTDVGTYSNRLFDIGLLIEKYAQMQTFTSVEVRMARICGALNRGRGGIDNTFQNRILNAFFIACGAGSYSIATAQKVAGTYSARVDTGDGTQTNQRTTVTTTVLPPVLVDTYELPVFARIAGEIKWVRSIDRVNSKVTLYSWVDLNAAASGPIDFLYGGGMMNIGGDAGLFDGKIASSFCAIGMYQAATYGGTIQLTAQQCGIGFVYGDNPGNAIMGTLLNLYAEANDADLLYNGLSASDGHLTVVAEQALDITKILYFTPRKGDNTHSLHLKPNLLLNYNGRWLSYENAPDIDGGLASLVVRFDGPNRTIPMFGNSPVIAIYASSASFNRLFGYRAATVQVQGTGTGNAPTGTLTVQVRDAAGNVDNSKKINGGTLGANATFALGSLTTFATVLIAQDPTNAANYLVSVR